MREFLNRKALIEWFKQYLEVGECIEPETVIEDIERFPAAQYLTIQQPKWISCAERLPTAEDANEFGEVLAIDRNGKRTAHHIWVFSSSYRPLWWLPFSALPQPPKEGE